MNYLTEAEKGYLAGIIDGEGCIRLARKNKKHLKVYMAYVIISNCNLALLESLKETAGIGIIYKYEKSGKPNWNPCHRWQIVAKQARELLEIVLPYLRLKKEIARLVLSAPVMDKRQVCKRDYPVEETRNRQESVFYKIKEMNFRGVKS